MRKRCLRENDMSSNRQWCDESIANAQTCWHTFCSQTLCWELSSLFFVETPWYILSLTACICLGGEGRDPKLFKVAIALPSKTQPFEHVLTRCTRYPVWVHKKHHHAAWPTFAGTQWVSAVFATGAQETRPSIAPWWQRDKVGLQVICEGRRVQWRSPWSPLEFKSWELKMSLFIFWVMRCSSCVLAASRQPQRKLQK